MISSFIVNALVVQYLLVTLIFLVFVVMNSDRTNIFRTVAEAAAILLLWPLLAIIYIFSEINDLLGGASDDERNEQ